MHEQPLTPDAIAAAEFGTTRRNGWDPAQVREFLGQAAHALRVAEEARAGCAGELEQARQAGAAAGRLRGELAQARADLDQFRQDDGRKQARADALRILDAAQRTADGLLADAQRTAAQLTADARSRAEDRIAAAGRKASDTVAEAEAEARLIAARIAAEAPVEAQARVVRLMAFGDSLTVSLRAILAEYGAGLERWEKMLDTVTAAPPAVPAAAALDRM